MNAKNRRLFGTLLAFVACAAIAAKVIKALYRGEITQSRVRPLN